MYPTSARISGGKNFVSIGHSFVRALPFNQVKSANAKGSAGGVFAEPGLPFSVACGPSASTRALEREPDPAGGGVAVIFEFGAAATWAGVGAEGGCAAGAFAGAAAGVSLSSKAAKRLLLSSRRSVGPSFGAR